MSVFLMRILNTLHFRAKVLSHNTFALTWRSVSCNRKGVRFTFDTPPYGFMPLTFPLRAGDLWFGAYLRI